MVMDVNIELNGWRISSFIGFYTSVMLRSSQHQCRRRAHSDYSVKRIFCCAGKSKLLKTE